MARLDDYVVYGFVWQTLLESLDFDKIVNVTGFFRIPPILTFVSRFQPVCGYRISSE